MIKLYIDYEYDLILVSQSDKLNIKDILEYIKKENIKDNNFYKVLIYKNNIEIYNNTIKNFIVDLKNKQIFEREGK